MKSAERNTTLAIAMALAALAFALYAPSLAYDYITYDDRRIIVGQPALFGRGFVEGMINIFTLLPREEPLLVRDVSWLVDSVLFGFGEPLGAHLGNVVLHALNCGLLFLLLRRLGFTLPEATVAGVAFVLHPVHVEPVAWAMGRKDVLSAFFALVCLLTWHLALRVEGGRKLVWFGACIATLGLGVLSKINLVVWPAVLWGVLWLEGQSRPRRAAWTEYAALVALVGVAGSAFLWYRSVVQAWGILGRGPPPTSAEHLARLTTFIPAQIVAYVDHFLRPQAYGVFYDRPAVGVATPGWQVAIGFAIVFGVFAGIVATRRRCPRVAFALGAGAVAFVPYLNIVYIGIVVPNRYLYVPSLFLSAVVAAAGVAAYRRRPVGRAGVTAVALVWVILAVAQHVRWLPAWQNDEAFWRYEAARPTPSLLGLQGRVRYFVRRAEALPVGTPERRVILEEAMALVEQGYAAYDALGVEPVDGYANYQQHYLSKLKHWEGRILEATGRPIDEVLAAYEAALAAQPSSRLVALMLARVHAKAAVLAQANKGPVAASKGQPAIELAPTTEAHVERSLQMIARFVALAETIDDKDRARALLDAIDRRFPTLQSKTRRVRTIVERAKLRNPAS